MHETAKVLQLYCLCSRISSFDDIKDNDKRAALTFLATQQKTKYIIR